MLKRALTWSRYLIIIAVIGSFIAAIIALVYAGGMVINMALNTFTHDLFTDTGTKHLAVTCIETIDLFLLGTVLYIIALGLYDLFIDDSLPMPSWLIITNLDDLKGKLLGIVAVLLAVTFLANIVEWNGSTSILDLGVSIGLVLLALTPLLVLGARNHHE